MTRKNDVRFYLILNTILEVIKTKVCLNDAFRKIIIVNQPILSGYNEQGILMLSLQDFLTSPETSLNF